MSILSKYLLIRSTTLTKAARQSCPKALPQSIWQANITHSSRVSTFEHTAKRPLSTTTFQNTPAALALKRSQPPDLSEHTPVAVPADFPESRIDERKVIVGFDTETWTRYHHTWLRDHCRCSECFHPITKQRLFSTFDIPPDLKPAKVESREDGLEVFWPSSVPHTSFYPWSWLREHSYDPPLRQTTPSEQILWSSKLQQTPPTVSYEEVMAPDDVGLFKWLSNIDKFGFSFVKGVPPTPEATEELSTRIGFIRETQYGKFWDFTSDLAKGDTAYTTLALGAHTDNTYFTDPCGLQLFHLLSHTEGKGGQTLLVDGFYVASILKELHPDVYATLSRVRVPAHAAGEAGAIYHVAHPILEHIGSPEDGDLVRVTWNNDDRSVMDHLSPSEMEEWYHAIRTWHKFLTSADSEYWVQLSPGTVVVADNHRVLHGRSAFDGKRRMCGAYIGRDEYRSKFEVLAERFAPDLISQERKKDVVNGRSIWSPYL